MRYREITEAFDENAYFEASLKAADRLVAKYGKGPVPYDKLPPAAQKAIHHYMMVDGEREDYATELVYIYGTIPWKELIREVWRYGGGGEEGVRQDFPHEDDLVAKHLRHPNKSKYLANYDYSKHDLENPWPVILGGDVVEDGWHRLSLYTHHEMDIPFVYCVDRAE